jgi:hypothetical protein
MGEARIDVSLSTLRRSHSQTFAVLPALAVYLAALPPFAQARVTCVSGIEYEKVVTCFVVDGSLHASWSWVQRSPSRSHFGRAARG